MVVVVVVVLADSRLSFCLVLSFNLDFVSFVFFLAQRYLAFFLLFAACAPVYVHGWFCCHRVPRKKGHCYELHRRNDTKTKILTSKKLIDLDERG